MVPLHSSSLAYPLSRAQGTRPPPALPSMVVTPPVAQIRLPGSLALASAVPSKASRVITMYLVITCLRVSRCQFWLPLRQGAGGAEQVAQGDRPAQTKALAQIAGPGLQQGPGFHGFDAFGDDFQAQAGSHIDGGSNNQLVLRLGSQVQHKGFVDLQLLNRHVAQLGQRGIAGSEIVH